MSEGRSALIKLCCATLSDGPSLVGQLDFLFISQNMNEEEVNNEENLCIVDGSEEKQKYF